MFRRPFFQSFILYRGSAILFYHLLSSIHVPPPPFSIFFPIYRFCHPVLQSFKQYTCSTASFFQPFFLYTGSAILFYHLLSSIHVPPPPFSIFFPIYRFCHPVLQSFKQYTCSADPFFQSFFLYTGSAILFYNLLNIVHVSPPPFSIFFLIYRFCHPVLPSFKQYTCSTASFFQPFFLYTGSAILFYHLLSSIHVPPPPFSIFFPIYRFCHPVLQSFKQYTCSADPFFQSFFLYTGSAILFYNLLNIIHVPPPPFSIFFLIYRFCHPVLPSFKQYTCSTASFFQPFFLYTGSAILFYHLLSSIHVPPPLFSIFFPIYRFCLSGPSFLWFGLASGSTWALFETINVD